MGLFWSNSLLEFEYFGRFFFVYLYVLSAFLIFKILNVNNDFIKIFLILFFILLTFEPYYFGGYQEYLIFSSLIIASRYIYIYNLNGSKNIKLIFLALLILYISCWFKNEGKIYFVIFSGVLIYLANINYYKKILFTLLIISLLLIQYFLQKYLIILSGSYDVNYVMNFLQNFKDINLLFTKLLKILSNIIIVFIKHPLWIIIFLAIFAQIFFIKKINQNVKYFLTCLFLNLLVITGVYMGMEDIDFTLRVTLDRVLFQTSGFYLILFLSIINFKEIYQK